MQTLSLFPQLFDFQMLGIFMIRITIGFIFVYFWYEKVFLDRASRIDFFRKIGLLPARYYFWIISSLEGILGILLIIGLWTQAAGITAGILMAVATFIKWRNHAALPKNTLDFYIILSVASFALLFLGPGAFAIDLPL